MIWFGKDSGFSERRGLVFYLGVRDVLEKCISWTHSFHCIAFVFNVHSLYRIVIPLEACVSFLFYLETKYLNYWTPLKTTETSESMMLETLVKLYENVKDVPETAALNLNSKRPNVMCLETKRNQTSAAVWLNISKINLLPLLGSFVRGALLVKSGSMWSTVSVFCFVWSPEDYHECHKLLFLKQLALFFFFTLKCIFYIKACLICLAFFFTCVSHI